MDSSPRTLRRVGLAATVILTIGVYASGALPATDPGARLRRFGWAATPPSYRVGVAICLIGTVGWLLAWHRLGSNCERSGTRWQLMTGLLWTMPLLLAPPLASRDAYSYACQGWLYISGADPYTVSPAAGSCPWVTAISPMWQHTTTPYGPLAIALSGGAARAAQAAPVSDSLRLLIAVTLLRAVAAVGVALTAWCVHRLAVSCGAAPARAVWLGAATPLMAIHALSAAHNDALMAGLVIAGLAVAAARPATVLGAVRTATGSGVLLGLATTVKITAAVALPFAVLLVVGWRPGAVVAGSRPGAGGRRRPWIRATAGVLGCAALTFLAMTTGTGLGWGWINALRDTATAVQWTSIPTAVGICVAALLRAAGQTEHAAGALTATRGVGMAMLVAVVAALGFTATRHLDRPRMIVACCGATFAAVAILSPVFYPWYALTPLAVLGASVVSKVGQSWLARAVVVLTLLVLPNGLGIAVLTKLPGSVLVVTGCCVLIVHWIRSTGGLTRFIRPKSAPNTPEPLPQRRTA